MKSNVVSADEKTFLSTVAPTGNAVTTPGNAVKGLAPGAAVYQYELIRQIGSGGMGTVFLARDTKLGRRVAIKFLHTTDAELTQRFLREAQTTASCSHENIVVIYEVGELKGLPFMVLEFLQGQPLNKLIAGQRVSAARAVELMVPVVRALVCAHEQNIVHRDLKPENIIVTDSGTIKVLDFGIAKVLHAAEPAVRAKDAEVQVPAVLAGEGGEITRQGAILGTISYMSPEQWGAGELDHRVDIWAVGIMLFQMLAGRHPLAPLQGVQLMVTADLSKPMPSLREVAPDVPAELASVVDRCLRKRKDERFEDALALLRALEPFLPGRANRELRIEESPYAGLSSFQEADADRFFGRTREITAMVNRIHDRSMLAVVGPSGAGKSSFVRAGVVPVLKRSGQNWETLIIRPGRDPLGALATIVAPLLSTSTTVEDEIKEQRQLVERMRAEPGYVGTVLRSRARRERSNILLFVDQLEELYTQVPDPADRKAFTTCLASIADDATAPMRVIVSLRSDFLDRVSEDERFMSELTQGLFFLAPPQQDGLRDALVQPAEMAGYRFETTELVEGMLEDLQAVQGALPLLQFAATRLWETRDPARKLLTERAYEEMGGIAGALATHADSVLEALSGAERTLVRALMLSLVTAEGTRAIVSVDELAELSTDAGEMQRLVHQLVQARLLVIQTGGAGTGATVEIVHESLIHSWPTLRKWLDESQEDTVFLDQLRAAARQWQAKQHDSGLLWRGEMVEEARRFQRRYRGEMPALQRDFLKAVFAQATRAARLRRTLVAAGVGALLLMVVGSAVALVVISSARQEAVRQAAVARKAEADAKGALTAIQEKEAQRQKAHQEAEEAKQRAERAKEDVERKNKELEGAVAKEKDARRLAQEKAEEARKAMEKASKALEEARQSEEKARVEAERARRNEEAANRELERKRATGAIHDLPTAEGGMQ